LLNYSFWYCSPVFFFLVECHTVWRQLLGLRGQASSWIFKKYKKKGDMWGANRCIE
jgi:hypothetical protein